MNDSEKPKSSWQERRQLIKHRCLVPFVYVEWKCEQLSELLKRWAFLDILGHAGRLTIIIAVIFYFMEAEERRKERHYQAWQVINSAQGKQGCGGRIDALQDLNRDGISLSGVDISKAHLPMLNLENANLWGANLAEAELWGANLAGAVLWDANLAGAVLFSTNLAGADLEGANLAGAYLPRANLAEADLWGANLAGATLRDANFAEVDLWGASFAGAIPSDPNIMNIKNWKEIERIELANIYGVKNPPDGFIEWAIEHGAVSMKYDDWKKLLSEKRQEKTKEK